MLVWMYVCIYVSMHVCMYVCMHVSMYVCLYVCMIRDWVTPPQMEHPRRLQAPPPNGTPPENSDLAWFGFGFACFSFGFALFSFALRLPPPPPVERTRGRRRAAAPPVERTRGRRSAAAPPVDRTRGRRPAPAKPKENQAKTKENQRKSKQNQEKSKQNQAIEKIRGVPFGGGPGTYGPPAGCPIWGEGPATHNLTSYMIRRWVPPHGYGGPATAVSSPP